MTSPPFMKHGAEPGPDPDRVDAGRRVPEHVPSFSDVVQRLVAGASKSNRGAGAYTRWINRPLGRRVAAFSYLRGFTPNQLTFVNAVLIFPALGAMTLAEPGVWTGLVVLALLAGYVLDSADGQLARLRGGGSAAGEWLDHVVDAVKTGVFHAAVLVVWFRFYDLGTPSWLLVPLGFLVVHLSFFFSLMLADDLRRLDKVKKGTPAPAVDITSERAPILRSFLVLPNDWGLVCLTVLLLAVQPVFMALYTLLLAANAVFLAYGWVRWYRELVTL